MDITDSYIRVLPRDLFNEAKLLQQLGRLTLAIHEGLVSHKLSYDHDGSPFVVHLGDSGELQITNIYFYVGGDTSLSLYTSYNSRLPNPLQFDTVDGATGYVFADNGDDFSLEFLSLFA